MSNKTLETLVNHQPSETNLSAQDTANKIMPVPEDDSDGSDSGSLNSSDYFSSPEGVDEFADSVEEASTSPAPLASVVSSPVDLPTFGPAPSSDAQVEPDVDLHAVKGMFRVLDLISEPGSGGLVDKIIICQDSLQEFINIVSPGAYSSLTKVNFKALDSLSIKPLGLYGSKSEIVRFLATLGIIDEAVARALALSKDHSAEPHLRSGLYLIRTTVATTEQVLVLYWPEDTTWDDQASSPVSRNRTTFMRYLSKITDQIACLMSSEHAQSIVWSPDLEGFSNGEDAHAQSNRFRTFKVTKEKEQEEAVEVREGFKTYSPLLVSKESTVRAELKPRLVTGETVQAVLMLRHVPAGIHTAPFPKEGFTREGLRALLYDFTRDRTSVRLGPNLSDDDIEILISFGLAGRYSQAFQTWNSKRTDDTNTVLAGRRKDETELSENLTHSMAQMEPVFREVVIDSLLLTYTSIHRNQLSDASDTELSRCHSEFSKLVMLYPDVQSELAKAMASVKADTIAPRSEFRPLKEHLIHIDTVLHERQDMTADERSDFLHRVCNANVPVDDTQRKPDRDRQGIRKWFINLLPTWIQQRVTDRIRIQVKETSDADFIRSLRTTGEPLYDALVCQALQIAHDHLRSVAANSSRSLLARATMIQEMTLKRSLESKAEASQESFRLARRLQLDWDMTSETVPPLRTVFIDAFSTLKSGYRDLFRYQLQGHYEHNQEAFIQYQLHYLTLTAHDLQALHKDSATIPSPQVLSHMSQQFVLPIEQRILHVQLIQTGEILLITEDTAILSIFLTRPGSLQAAISRGHKGALRFYSREQFEHDLIIGYDELKRALFICEPTKLTFHMFEFDEAYASLQQKSSLELHTWYSPGTFVTLACFVSGGEEMLVVDSEKEARIYSLIPKQFRPASLSLPDPPVSAHSSPDGSCLLLLFECESGHLLRAYHWSTFGSSDGLDVVPLYPINGFVVVSSLGDRSNVHVVSFDTKLGICQSSALAITKKDADFTFRETKGESSSGFSTAHNCLVNCHSDVWTQFPVIAAIQRQTIVSGNARLQRTITFVTDRGHSRFEDYFDGLICSFEDRTRKPTGNELKRIHISAMEMDEFVSLVSLFEWSVSAFRVGEWVVDLLCLIPIQIAIARENHFLPLQDGVTSTTLEQQLLGAEVCQIVDAISLGWYESIFQSYLASKPVQVVSSMGEQSVGKSFMLNHLVDTSFAGSAMRTTEGVWMSVTPTEKALIVALDFEGVHSIERTPQEDMLLVLFNTAISNLVLFRNNYAMSRSITGLFQSFQSSSTVLDPAANPQLFRSSLVIIIKDVVASDTQGIFTEFATKFHNIVQREQESNFISRLHGGDVHIVPWHVIESRAFYLGFKRLKADLEGQEITHPTAGEFLHTLKTLMAKLKANDWGALSETLAAHRAQKLRACLPTALMYGFSEVRPNQEPLKNFDTDDVIQSADTLASFFLSDPEAHSSGDLQTTLATLQDAWDQFDNRHHWTENEWAAELDVYLTNLVELRIQHVFDWISSNLSRFTVSHANMELLLRDYDVAKVDLKSNVEICRMQCSSCDLLCLLSRRHGSNTPHDCRTSHLCPRACDFGEEHDTDIICGYRAGHSGKHICVVDTHLCGEECVLSDKNGCMGKCTRVAGHGEDDHMCSAPVHACGKPCCLKIRESSQGDVIYSCRRTCTIPSYVVHEQHVCDMVSCPLSCELCEGLCSSTDHLHGLADGSVHQCGRDHGCPEMCSEKGNCKIETHPQSVEAIFTGRHDIFQFTKYSQVAKRLQCAIRIPAGEREHTGPHIHSTESDFHHCDTRCGSCGYYCTLPRGHPQKEHHTSHGSMSNTIWAVEGLDGVIELQGHRFASNDDGAPMNCNIVCRDMGRHVHVAYCEADEVTSCASPGEIQHATTRITPHPDRPKDWISHSLYWRRSGFKDPYSKDDQYSFAKCDAICSGLDHAAGSPPSYCYLPLFHPKPMAQALVPTGHYLSRDGHIFPCKNPADIFKIFHVIFVIDRSSSMKNSDLRPLLGTPKSALISQHSSNRLGAVFSALYSFWIARDASLNAGRQGDRRDSCSVVFFNDTTRIGLENDTTSTPDELLNAVVSTIAERGTSFSAAISTTADVMRRHWSEEREPVIIFLSDGECTISDETMTNLCSSAIALGKPLSFHSVLFGQHSATLERMQRLASEIQNTAAGSTIPSTFSRALNTVDLTQTFLGFADSLRKPRGSLLRG